MEGEPLQAVSACIDLVLLCPNTSSNISWKICRTHPYAPSSFHDKPHSPVAQVLLPWALLWSWEY